MSLNDHHCVTSYHCHHWFCSVATSPPLYWDCVPWGFPTFVGFLFLLLASEETSSSVLQHRCFVWSVCGFVCLVSLPSDSHKLKSLLFGHWGQLHGDLLSFVDGRLVFSHFCPSTAGVTKPVQDSEPGIRHLSRGWTFRHFPAFGSCNEQSCAHLYFCQVF